MLFFFYGKEPFESAQRVRDLRERFLLKHPTGSGYHFFDCSEDATYGNIVNALGAQSLFVTEQLLVIKDFFATHDAAAQKDLIPLLERSGDDVVVLWENSMLRKNAKLFTWLTKNAHESAHFPELQGTDLSRWIVQRSKHYSATIDTQAVQALIVAAGDDLFRLDQELGKLSAFTDGREIGSSDVALLVRGRTDGDIFGALESLVQGSRAHALTLLQKQIASGDDVHHIYSMYVYQIRTLLMISGMYHEQNVRDQSAIAKACKLHPYVVQKSFGVLSRITHKTLVQAHDALFVIDQDVKLGKRDLQTALSVFVGDF